MTSDLVGVLIPALAFIVIVLLMFGLPALAVVVVKYLKFKERELTLEMEFRQSSQHQQLDFEQRVQRLENALASLDEDVRVRMGIGQPATPLPSRPELGEGPGAPDAAARALREQS
ncbi:MAG: hypothetical protein ACJ79H_23555 [Myxococcales bacterium]